MMHTNNQLVRAMQKPHLHVVACCRPPSCLRLWAAGFHIIRETYYSSLRVAAHLKHSALSNKKHKSWLISSANLTKKCCASRRRLRNRCYLKKTTRTSTALVNHSTKKSLRLNSECATYERLPIVQNNKAAYTYAVLCGITQSELNRLRFALPQLRFIPLRLIKWSILRHKTALITRQNLVI